MDTKDWLQAIPGKRIAPVDGMAVTAEVWEEAHRYHREHQRLHLGLGHGSGILTGLEVIASDPPDSTVYILPGIGVDPQGQLIIVKEPVTYDIGRNTEGVLSVFLSYGEGRPQSSTKKQGAPLYAHSEFGIEVRSGYPETPGIELARIDRSTRNGQISNAVAPDFPGVNEIDLRYRRYVGAPAVNLVSVAISYVGDASVECGHREGLTNVARAASRVLGAESRFHVVIDDGVALSRGLESFALLVIVGQGEFELTPPEMEAVYAYLQGGGTVLMEACARGSDEDSAGAAVTSFRNLLATLGVTLSELEAGHRLLSVPYLFASVPEGAYLNAEGSAAMIGESVILSTGDLGCLWQGRRHNSTPSREEIRSALEWGCNVISYAWARRERV
ncbi:MAG: DUF4159 domain-containing protein [Chloroflexi bacterium]|nr:DUF4159 domain-containing protein [Chloroflexota bacterium]